MRSGIYTVPWSWANCPYGKQISRSESPSLFPKATKLCNGPCLVVVVDDDGVWLEICRLMVGPISDRVLALKELGG